MSLEALCRSSFSKFKQEAVKMEKAYMVPRKWMEKRWRNYLDVQASLDALHRLVESFEHDCIESRDGWDKVQDVICGMSRLLRLLSKDVEEKGECYDFPENRAGGVEAVKPIQFDKQVVPDQEPEVYRLETALAYLAKGEGVFGESGYDSPRLLAKILERHLGTIFVRYEMTGGEDGIYLPTGVEVGEVNAIAKGE